jgi:diguanylate cyclase (GGDEF)-like protein/PAS domain S-box-containing protein
MRIRSAAERLVAVLPRAGSLPEGEWRRRHGVIAALLWLHVPGIVAFGFLRGEGSGHLLAEVTPIAVMAALASTTRVGRRVRVVMTSVGLISSSAVIVHFSGGVIEAHFHFFVVVALISVYYDWLPFLVAIAYTAVHHGLIGNLVPQAVYDHPSAIARPWLWAGIHAGFVLAASAATLLTWRMNEEDHRRAEEAIEGLSRRNELLLNSAGEGIFGLDGNGEVTFVNPAATRMLGHDQLELEGRSMHGVLHHILPDGRPCRECPVAATLQGEGPRHGNEVYRRSDGTHFPVEYLANPIQAERDTVGAVVTFRDITDRKDSLTGLESRAWFIDRTAEALARARRHGTRVALFFIDVDRFKLINDSMGHAAGDEVLVVVAGRLEACLRPYDSVARFGGDEFVVLCEDLPTEVEAALIAERLMQTFETPLTLAGGEVFASISVGIAMPADAEVEPEALIRDADAAMYRAKRRGGRSYEIFDEAMRAHAENQLWMENALRRAIDGDELRLLYQPIVKLATGGIVGAEALVRWEHPERGLLAPDSFIPVAEDTGLIVPIGEWVLKEACRQALPWQHQATTGVPLRMSVNLSARQLAHGDLARTVGETLQAVGLDPSVLILEVTESAVMEDTEMAIGVLRQLKALGVGLAIDDFGTGYSSLAYLQRFPVDILKIDRSFVGALHTPEGRAIVEASLTLAHALGLSGVAEGVETLEQVACLRTLSCDTAQGYHFARPMPAKDLLRLPRQLPQADPYQQPVVATRSTSSRSS